MKKTILLFIGFVFLLSQIYSQTVTDIDGNVYNVVTIGTQTWMAENLKTTTYNNGNAISLVTGNTEWRNLTTGAYCWFNNDETVNKDIYGALYNWYAVNTDSLCPIGWHVPTNTEWTTLLDFLGGSTVAGGKLKETGTTHWTSPNTDATNESGFTALPGGARIVNGAFNISSGGYGYWWTATPITSTTATGRYMMYYAGAVSLASTGKYGGFSVRCLSDTTIATNINSEPYPKKINIFPNPATNIVNISGLSPNTTIEIFSLSGQKIKQFNLGVENFKIDIADLKRGLYIIKISDNLRVFQQKLMK